MDFLRITQQHPYLTTIRIWYEDSFPIDERRLFNDLVALLSYSDMHLCALIDSDQLMGFIIYWQWTDVVFVEHFVIDPEQRGKHFGQQALAHLLRIASPTFILEVERPVDEISHRRIQFYERQGFVLNSFDYVQPPYRPEKAAIPMRLMSIPAIGDQADFEKFSAQIKEHVYERFYS